MSVKGTVKYAMYKMLPFDIYLKAMYRRYVGGKLNINNPKRFSEKIYWLKKYNPKNQLALMQEIYDKYSARQYVSKKIGEGHSPRLYGVYERAEDIDFSVLPEKYVLKVSQSNGFNIIIDGRISLSQEEIVAQLSKWLRLARDKALIEKRMKEEAYYFNGKAVILCEEYLEDENGVAAMDTDFYCFNGEPLFHEVYFDYIVDGKPNPEGCVKNIYRLDGTFIPVSITKKIDGGKARPEYKNFDQMVEIARALAQDFVFVRVDLYNVNGKIYVGELTPIPSGGNIVIDPIEYDYQWGEELHLPE